ncbi:MAG: AAA family ATPase [Firmicutes bacterium]|nr:AAA family ATPase [Bacillota bacterium]
MKKLIDLIHTPGIENWTERCKNAFEELFGAGGGRYPDKAKKAVTLRAPVFQEGKGVTFASLIHPANPDSGAYGGMSFVLFPAQNAPCLLSMVVGTQGLSPDEEILARPGHGRKVSAICNWLNKKHGRGKLVAWAKQDPVRTDIDLPGNIKRLFPDYDAVFERYGRVIYGFFQPVADKKATEDALKAFLDLLFEERGIYPLKAAANETEQIRSEYFAHLMPDVTEEEVLELLRERRFVVLQGPPGTGKTRLALRILQNAYRANGFSIQFHPNTTYENFIGGLAPVLSGDALGFRFAPQPGFLMKAAKEALKKPDQPFLLHIDEINRADLAKVLGEAIFLLEANSAEQRKLDLPYDFKSPFGDKLWLPPNLHILGTMNSADRSIAIVDVAVRRRFAYLKLWPQLQVVQEHACELMKKAFMELVSVFVEYAGEDALDLVPGHSYFLEKDEKRAPKFLKTNLAPLLEEYLAQGYVAGFSEPVRAYLQWIESLQG